MKIIPCAFGSDGPSMLAHLSNLLDSPDNLIAIPPQFTKLITALKGATSVEYRLLKEDSPYNDLTDAMRLACKFFTLER